MRGIKRTLLFALAGLALVFLFASVAAADAPPSPEYVYYEKLDGEELKIIVVNYQDAINLKAEGWPKLYNKTVQGVEDALANFRGVWVEIVDGDEVRIVDYSGAIGDGVPYEDAWDNTDYYGDEGDRPDPDLEMFLDQFNIIRYRVADPVSYPDWLNDGETQVTWASLINKYVVEVTLIEESLPNDSALDDITAVEILGVAAVRESDSSVWRAIVPGVVADPPVVGPGAVRIMIDGTWYDR